MVKMSAFKRCDENPVVVKMRAFKTCDESALCRCDTQVGPRKPAEGILDCDYEVDCTPLYSSLERKDWAGVAFFLDSGFWPGHIVEDENPPYDQARTRVTRYEPGSDKKKIKWSQLPLHLALVVDAPLAVVRRLVEVFPESIRCTDDQGMLPLHVAMRHGASDEATDYVLQAFPDAVLRKGKKDRTALDCAMRSEKRARGSILATILRKCRSQDVREKNAEMEEKIKEMKQQMKDMAEKMKEMKEAATTQAKEPVTEDGKVAVEVKGKKEVEEEEGRSKGSGEQDGERQLGIKDIAIVDKLTDVPTNSLLSSSDSSKKDRSFCELNSVVKADEMVLPDCASSEVTGPSLPSKSAVSAQSERSKSTRNSAASSKKEASTKSTATNTIETSTKSTLSYKDESIKTEQESDDGILEECNEQRQDTVEVEICRTDEVFEALATSVTKCNARTDVVFERMEASLEQKADALMGSCKYANNEDPATFACNGVKATQLKSSLRSVGKSVKKSLGRSLVRKLSVSFSKEEREEAPHSSSPSNVSCNDYSL